MKIPIAAPLFGMALLVLAHFSLVRPWMLTWGASRQEIHSSLPGDQLVPQPVVLSTRAITIHAAANDIWPWLVQIGQGRGGFYSYAWLENLFGCDIHNADRILPGFQSLKVGDGIRLHRDGPPIPVVCIQPGHVLVLAGQIDPRNGQIRSLSEGIQETYFPTSWTFILQELSPTETRLIARYRLACPNSLLYRAGCRFLLEPISFIMERKMLLGIRERVHGLTRRR